MKNIKIALLQLMPEDSLEGNLKKGIQYCKKSKEMGADIALFPEMWNVGYNIPAEDSALNKNAVSSEDVFVKSFAALAKELNMAIGITYLEKYNPLPRNTLTLFDRFGKEVLTYAKVHTCDFFDERKLTAGDVFMLMILILGAVL